MIRFGHRVQPLETKTIKVMTTFPYLLVISISLISFTLGYIIGR